MRWVFSSLVKGWTRAVVAPLVRIAARLGDGAEIMSCMWAGERDWAAHGRNWNLRVGFLQAGKLKSRPVRFLLLTTHHSTRWFLFLLCFFFHVFCNYLFSSASASLLFPVTRMRRSLLSHYWNPGSSDTNMVLICTVSSVFCVSDDELRDFQSWTCCILI